MGLLVTIAILWMALILTIVITYTVGPPARRLLSIRADVLQAAEEVRQRSTEVRDRVIQQLQMLERPVATTLADYQSARRQLLPDAEHFAWDEKALSRWQKREVVDRGHAIRHRNIFALIAWNLSVSVVFGLAAWAYYQHIASKVRPQVIAPSTFPSTVP